MSENPSDVQLLATAERSGPVKKTFGAFAKKENNRCERCASLPLRIRGTSKADYHGIAAPLTAGLKVSAAVNEIVQTSQSIQLPPDVPARRRRTSYACLLCRT